MVLNNEKKIRRIGKYHTNTIDGFWGLLKRAVMGQYHRITERHLQDYINEIAFKYNHRNNPNRLDVLINNCLNSKNAFT